jgi:hypothetical protein
MNSSAPTSARHAPLAAKRRDEAHDHDQAGFHHQLRDFGNAADVLDPVLVGEAEIAAEAVADVVAVEHHGVVPRMMQRLLDEIRNGRFPEAETAAFPARTPSWQGAA